MKLEIQNLDVKLLELSSEKSKQEKRIANKMDEFDNAINNKDTLKTIEILKSVELTDDNINDILKSFRMPALNKECSPQSSTQICVVH